MNYTENNIANIHGYAKGLGYSQTHELKINHEWNAVKVYNEWCLIDSTWGVGDNSDFYLCTPPEFFIRKHLPQESQQEFQLLNNPMSKEVYKDLAEVDKGFYKYNVTLIEDKYIQNICGKGKLNIIINQKLK